MSLSVHTLVYNPIKAYRGNGGTPPLIQIQRHVQNALTQAKNRRYAMAGTRTGLGVDINARSGIRWDNQNMSAAAASTLLRTVSEKNKNDFIVVGFA